MREDQDKQRVADGLKAIAEVMATGATFWASLRAFARARRLTTSDDEGALTVACSMPKRVPTDWQSAKLLAIRRRCEEAGFVGAH